MALVFKTTWPQLVAISVLPVMSGAPRKRRGFGRRPVGISGVEEVSSGVRRPASALGQRCVLTLCL